MKRFEVLKDLEVVEKVMSNNSRKGSDASLLGCLAVLVLGPVGIVIYIVALLFGI